MDKQELNDKLLNVSLEGDFDTIKYLLTSPDLKEHADIHYTNKYGTNTLMIACIHGNLEVVKYLLTSPDLKEHSNINYKDNNGINALMFAVSEGHLEIIKYLLTSSDLKEHSNINAKDNYGTNALIHACKYGHLEIVKDLIIDMNMTIDNHTMNWLQGNNEKEEVYNDVLKLIEVRDLHDKLNKSIRDDKINNKKVKL